MAWSSPACPASSAARTCASSTGASARRVHGNASSHSIQSLVVAVSAPDASPRRRRSRAMAARTAGGNASASPAPSTSRTTAGVTTAGPPVPGALPRPATARQMAASLAFRSATPVSLVCSRITWQSASGSKRTSPAQAAVRHASAGAGSGAAADNACSPSDDGSKSNSTAGPSAAASCAARAGTAASGARHPAGGPPGCSSKGRFNRYRSAMTSFSCSV